VKEIDVSEERKGDPCRGRSKGTKKSFLSHIWYMLCGLFYLSSRPSGARIYIRAF